MTVARRSAGAVAVSMLLFIAGCSGSSSSGKSSGATLTPLPNTSSVGSNPPSTSGTASAPSAGNLYVSIGDSYAAGFQPSARGSGRTTRNGFAYQLVSGAKAKGYDLRLTNFGCAGATTTSVLQASGCEHRNLGPGATPYDGETQAAAAEEFLRAHRGQVALITVSLGGNDITRCGDAASPAACLSPALATVKRNLATLLSGLRTAAGPTTRIVGITYPDVLLGDYLSKTASVKKLARLSVIAFQGLINPALQSAYRAVGGAFVDVTAATGAYGSLTAMTTLAPYGRIPVPVAKVCALTYFCQFQDIHPRTPGYALIARLIAASLPAR
ncbi:MAG: SGNH/GDSL hydrolase family protein [Jatrophihabitantaceae bacterium]